ncbi:MAG TPA: hypothetical protein VFC65_17905 [Prolixibacteraceae bacterium]|nr:hypothetical protein [Prolixibacteraceae bacterium]
MKNVFFKPWVGENYSTTGISGKKILLLGESHICGGCNDCGNLDYTDTDCREFTTNTINTFLKYKSGEHEHKGWMNTYTKVGNILYNKGLSSGETAAFWDSIIFYNYVQYSTDKARVSPVNEEFEKSSAAFFEILEAYKPDLIFVWGERLWDQLPFSEDFGEDIIIENSNGGKFYYYTIDEKKIPIYMVNHPSSSAFNYSRHKFMQKAIEMI